MDNLTGYFNGCSLSTEEIRENIKKILGLTEADFFCYKCFRLIELRFNKHGKCEDCYQVFCEGCTKNIIEKDELLIKRIKYEVENGMIKREIPKPCINRKVCPYCQEEEKFLNFHGF